MLEPKKVLLKDLLVTSKDGDWGKGDPEEGYVPFNVIRATDFSDTTLGLSGKVPLRYLSEKTVQRRTLEANDILIETAGGSPGRPTGRTMLVTDRVLSAFSLPITCASFARFLRVDKKLVDPRYLYWYLQFLYQSGEIEQYQVQHTGVARFQYTNFAATHHVPVVGKREQQAIAEVLGALDDKIAANTKLIASTDSLAQAQFQAALNDCQPKPLSSLAQFVNGKAFTKGASGTGRVVVRIAELNSGIGNSTVFSDANVDDRHVVRPGDTLFAWSGSLTLHRWFRDEAIVNQHIFKVIPTGETPDWLIYELLRNKLEDFKMIAADKATTMGHIQRKHLDEPVLVPSEGILRDMAPSMNSLWRTALNTERENLTLATTRDVLLPHLMSGKLRIQDAEDLISAAI